MSAVQQRQGPTRTLLPTATTKDTWQAVRALCRSHRLLATGAVLTLVAGTAAGLFVPPILGDLVDLVLAHRGPDAITEPVVLLIISAIAQALLTGLGYVLVSQLGETVLATLRERVVRRTVGLPLEQVERAGSGDLVARVSGDVSVVADAVRTALPALAAAALTIGLTLVGLAALDWRFAIAGLIAAPIQFLALRWYLANSTPQFAAERIAEGARTQQLLDSVGGADTVRTFRLSTIHVSAVRTRSRGAVEYALGTNRMATRFFGRLNLAEFVGLTAILSVGFLLVRSGAISVGATAAAALYFHRLFDPINTLLGLFGTAQEASAGLGRLVGIAEAPVPEAPTAWERPQDNTLRVTGVDFGYQQAHPVLHDISFEIAPGEHVALVGESGAGKTTLAKLIAGVHEPSSGSLTLGGVPIGSLAEDRLRRAIALVTQEVHVFAGPLAEDLRLVRPAATDEQLGAALDKVAATAWVDALPEGLATVVGESGHPLTATQGQQLALARLLLADPDIAVLDEATADAGSAGARLLDRAAARALDGRGALIVAHRLSQAITADRILVLAAGRIVESGSHQQLVAAHGRYAQLWQAWSGARDTKSTVDSQ